MKINYPIIIVYDNLLFQIIHFLLQGRIIYSRLYVAYCTAELIIPDYMFLECFAEIIIPDYMLLH